MKRRILPALGVLEQSSAQVTVCPYTGSACVVWLGAQTGKYRIS